MAGRIAQLFVSLVLASGTFLDAPTATAGRTGSTTGSSRVPICDVPTSGEASSVEGIVSFDQKMLRFEEFGTQALNHSLGNKGESKALPAPETAYGFPSNDKLDEFIGKPLYPFPPRDTNQGIANSWQSVIEATHTGPLAPLPGKTLSSFADGRPAGPQFGHQRWQELMPRTYFETVVTGARTNSGVRDSAQSHFYQFGEFGPGPDLKSGTSDDGLYHSVYEYSGQVHSSSPHAAAADSKTGLVHMSLQGTAKGLPIAFHPKLAPQDPQSLWTFDGTLPPKLLMARVGQPILFRNNNALPIKFESNRGFGNHFITTHEHNGHNPAESDGFAQAYFLPGQFYDYHWPMVLAGHDTINTDRSDDGAAIACDPGEWVTVYVPGYGDTIK